MPSGVQVTVPCSGSEVEMTSSGPPSGEPATREVPRRLQHPKRKTIGLRVPDHVIAQSLLTELNEPLMSSTLILPGEDLPLSDPEEIRTRLEHDLDLVVDGGFCGLDPTTVIGLEDGSATLLRQGKGDSSRFAA